MAVQRTKWVVGFLFRKNKEVALISKTHPAWQKGKLNGVGGKVNEGELPLEAMQREFLEEAGAKVSEWREFVLLRLQDGDVHFFSAHGDYAIQSMTEEKVAWHALADIGSLPVISNLAWLIPLALDPGTRHAVIEHA